MEPWLGGGVLIVEVKDMRQLFELALKIETAVAGGAAANAGPWDQMRALTGPWAVFGPRTLLRASS